MEHPFLSAEPRAFWKTGVVASAGPVPEAVYLKKWPITPNDSVATAGSCFAQHIGWFLKGKGCRFLDVEPAPAGVPVDLAARYGYGLFSARYGNIYTSRQLLQLAREVSGDCVAKDNAWQRNDRFIDAFRPGVEPEGLSSPEEVRLHRDHHLRRVGELFRSMDVFIFTLGLTETWLDRHTGLVYPLAPGTVGHQFDPARHQLLNLSFNEVRSDLIEFMSIMASLRPPGRPLRYLMTVSPVPLTATASRSHVLSATCYSKAVLRAVAGELAQSCEAVDYFPSFEIITNPVSGGAHFEENKRTVRRESVRAVMDAFFGEHAELVGLKDGRAPSPAFPHERALDEYCDELLLEAFAR